MIFFVSLATHIYMQQKRSPEETDHVKYLVMQIKMKTLRQRWKETAAREAARTMKMNMKSIMEILIR
jgi:hypothetical protein